MSTASLYIIIMWLETILEIGIGVATKQYVVCDIFINPATWLIISGCVKLYTVYRMAYISLNIQATTTYNDVNIQKIIVQICGFFCISWTIVGSIILWNKCDNFGSDVLEVTLWIAMLRYWIYFLSALINIDSKKYNKKIFEDDSDNITNV